MPYCWIDPNTTTTAIGHRELHLWPHQSLAPEGYVKFIAVTAILITVPLFPVLGTFVFWGLLPFLLLTLFGVKWALDRNRADSQILEVLTLDPQDAHLHRSGPRQKHQSWSCNRYWARVQIHPNEGPVPHYVTLSGAGREVEIGAFLSEDERKALYDELCRELAAD